VSEGVISVVPVPGGRELVYSLVNFFGRNVGRDIS